MGLATNILYTLIFLVVIYIVINMFQKPTKLSSMNEGNVETVIKSDKLSNSNTSTNYSYSMWFYVDDWNYKFGKPKVLWKRLDKDNKPSPSVTLGAMENDITISLACFPTSSSLIENKDSSFIKKCVVKNVPLQKWVNIIISLDNETLDIYLDGKLYKTCILYGVPKGDINADVHITPDGGFSGWTSNFQYFDKSKNPQEAYNIYKAGYGGSSLGNMFNKYRLRVQFLKDNDVAAGFEI